MSFVSFVLLVANYEGTKKHEVFQRLCILYVLCVLFMSFVSFVLLVVKI